MRKAEVSRTTAETALSVRIDLDGTGRARQPDRRRLLRPHARPAGAARADRHEVRATGDLHVDDHHTVEDVGIALGRALARGARRQARDPALRRRATSRWTRRWCAPRSTSRGGRSWCGRSTSRSAKIGSFDTELVREFFTALAMNARMTLNVALLDGENSHHIAEAAFKAVAQALRAAVEPDPRMADSVPSTKGTLDRHEHGHRRLRERQPALGPQELSADGRRRRRAVAVTADPEAVRAGGADRAAGRRRLRACPAGSRRSRACSRPSRSGVIADGVPFLGICVGHADDGDRGLEHGEHAGLRLDPGEVVRIAPTDPALKVPHMGWNALDFAARRIRCSRASPPATTPTSSTPTTASRPTRRT